MEIKNLTQLLERQKSFASGLAKSLPELRKKLPETPKAFLAVRKQALQQAQEGLQKFERERQAVLKRLDSDIAAQKAMVAKLSSELVELEKAGGANPDDGKILTDKAPATKAVKAASRAKGKKPS